MKAGQVYGRLTAIAFVRMDKHGHQVWAWLCSCGNKHAARVGATRSCGCLKRDTTAATGKANTTHGMTDSPEFVTWRTMMQRCENPNHHAFKRYGGRGIAVCGPWRVSFDAFYADMGPRPSLQHSIDRMDNDGPYCPENCKWSTKSEQARNRRNNRIVVVDGIKMSLAEAAERAELNYDTVRDRLERGWNIARAIGVA